MAPATARSSRSGGPPFSGLPLDDVETLKRELEAARLEALRLREELAAERGRCAGLREALAQVAAGVHQGAPAPARPSKSADAMRRARNRELGALGFSYDPVDGWHAPWGDVFESPADALEAARKRAVECGQRPGAPASVTGHARARPVSPVVATPPLPLSSALPPTPTLPISLPLPLPVPSLRDGAAAGEPGQADGKPAKGGATSRGKAYAPKTSEEERAARTAVEDAYLVARGEAYRWTAEDWGCLRECLKLAGGDTDALVERWRVGLELGAKWPGVSKLRQLASNWGDLLAHMRQTGRQPRNAREARADAGGDRPNVPGFDLLYQTES